MAGKSPRSKAPRAPQKFTYADYLTWPDDERWEIIDGDALAMTPSPALDQQRLLGRLFNRIFSFLEGKTCEAFMAPFDVRLGVPDANEEHIDSVVQPDIMVICDPEKIDRRGIKGAPDFIVEIVSPSTASNDYVRKLRLYERHGVKEYWILHPGDKNVLVFLLGKDGAYQDPITYKEEDLIKAHTLKGLTIDLKTIFAKEGSRTLKGPT